MPPATYLATARAGDAEMARRIALHQERRARQPIPWRTIEEPVHVPDVVKAHREGTLLLECLPLWLTNLLLTEGSDVAGEVARLCDALETASGQVIVVSNEVGCGIIPEN